MRKTKLIAGCLLTLSAIGLVACSHPREHPTRTQIEALEGQLKMPAGAGPLNSYRRYYWYERQGEKSWYHSCEGYPHVPAAKGHPMVGGVLIRSDWPEGNDLKSLLQRVSGMPPTICDGGCEIVELTYDPTTKRFAEVACHGEG